MDLLAEARVKRPLIVKSILDWSSDNLRTFPWREKRDPYRVLVAEFLLKRTTASAVNRIYCRFIERYPSISKLARADEKGLEEILKTIGYHKVRSKTMIETANIIMRDYNGIIPDTKQSLLSIRNIGPYTAGAILSMGYGKKASIVDSNVERILKRIFINLLPDKGIKKAIRKVAELLVPKSGHEEFNLALLDIGALICTYRGTFCEKCPISNLCEASRYRFTGASA